MGKELPAILSATSSSRSRTQSEDRTGEGASPESAGGSLFFGSNGGPSSRMGSAHISPNVGDGDSNDQQSGSCEKKCHRSGRPSGNEPRARSRNEGRQGDASCSAPARGEQDSDGVGKEVNSEKDQTSARGSMVSLTSDLCHQIECAQLTIEKELERLKSVWTSSSTGGKTSLWKLDLLEIYCEEGSQITEHASRLGLKARRFTFRDGDLSTSSGRSALWKVILEEKTSRSVGRSGLQILGQLQSPQHGQKHQHRKQDSSRKTTTANPLKTV